ncbi:MAG: FadR family transcriptional regulator [Hyphomicrobiales bacterium]|nr:MAG: FadR family transcriptional regulator [Hyphomicrobiales bacterium]
MSSEPAQPTRAYQFIADQIEKTVISGELKPGDRLPSERELVEQFGVSRPTIREALRVLESNHLVKSRLGDRRGPLVLPVSSHPLRKSMTRLAAGGEVSLESLLQFRMVVDSTAAHLAAINRTEDELLQLERANARMRVSVDATFESFSEADVEFHRIVARASGNQLLELAGEAVRDSVRALIARRINDADDSRMQMQSSVNHHNDVLGAIRKGDGRRAAWLTRESLYWYYFDYVGEENRATLRSLVDELQN